MHLGFLKRGLKKEKTELVTLEDAEAKLLEIIEEGESSLSEFKSQKFPELRSAVKKLIFELEAFDSLNLHPRLRNAAKNFVSVALGMWSDLNEADRDGFFEEAAKNMEKLALMKVKHFRILFAVNPPEIARIDRQFREIAEIISIIENKKSELKLLSLKNALSTVKEIKELQKERELLSKECSEADSELKKLKSLKERRDGDELRELLAEMERMAEEVKESEKKVQKKMAYARKPLKIYAHMIGSRIDTGSPRLLDEPDIEKLASKAALEIRKGSIKLKEKRIDVVLASLNDISNGELKKEFKKISKLKNELADIKNRIKIVKAEMDAGKPGRERVLEKRLQSVNERIKQVDAKILAAKKDLEKELHDVLNITLKLQL